MVILCSPLVPLLVSVGALRSEEVDVLLVSPGNHNEKLNQCNTKYIDILCSQQKCTKV